MKEISVKCIDCKKRSVVRVKNFGELARLRCPKCGGTVIVTK